MYWVALQMAEQTIEWLEGELQCVDEEIKAIQRDILEAMFPENPSAVINMSVDERAARNEKIKDLQRARGALQAILASRSGEVLADAQFVTAPCGVFGSTKCSSSRLRYSSTAFLNCKLSMNISLCLCCSCSSSSPESWCIQHTRPCMPVRYRKSFHGLLHSYHQVMLAIDDSSLLRRESHHGHEELLHKVCISTVVAGLVLPYTLLIGALIAHSSLKLSCFGSLEQLLNHMLESDSRPQPKKEDPGAPLPFVGREQDIEWVREMVGKSKALLGCDLPWCLRRTQKSTYEVLSLSHRLKSG